MRARLLAVVSLVVFSVIYELCGAAIAFPDKTLTIIVNGAAGSVVDIAARPVAEKLRVALGKPVIIDNRPGGGGFVAMRALKSSPSDGHTLAVITSATMVWNRYIYDKLPFDPDADFIAVSPLQKSTSVLVLHPSVPANTFKEFSELARSRPGELNYASSGIGTPSHVMFEVLKGQTGLDIRHVPFRSGTDAISSIVRGDTQAYLISAVLVESLVAAGKLKAIAISQRTIPSLMKVPTPAEEGISGMDGAVWTGLATVAGVPKEIVERLNREISLALSDADMVKMFAVSGSTPYIARPDEFAAQIRADNEFWGPKLRALKLKPE